MGMMTAAMKKIGLYDDGEETPAAKKKQDMEAAQERLKKRADDNKGKKLNRFQEEREKALGTE